MQVNNNNSNNVGSADDSARTGVGAGGADAPTASAGARTNANGFTDDGNEDLEPQRTESYTTSPTDSLDIVEGLSGPDKMKLRYRWHLKERSKHVSPRIKAKRAIHWLELLEILSHMQDQPDNPAGLRFGEKHKELHVPEETVAYLGGVVDLHENNWDVHVLNGCRVRVLVAAESEGLNRKIILMGSEWVVELVASRIAKVYELQVTGDPLIAIRKAPVPIVPSVTALKRNNLPVPLIRGVWGLSDDEPGLTALDQPSPPIMGSVRELAEFVEDLVRPRNYRIVNKVYDPRNPEAYPNEMRVERSLVAIFEDEGNQQFLSTGALNYALKYLLDHEFLASARAVFARAEHLATVDSFNLFLRSAARQQNLTKFHEFLTDMGQMNIRPNSDTWVAFVDCVVVPGIKRDIINRITERGYVTGLRAQRSLMQYIGVDSFQEHMVKGGDVDSFMTKMQETYNEAFSINNALLNQMFDVIFKLRKFRAADRLLEITLQQGLPVNNQTLVLLLRIFRNNINMAIWSLFEITKDREIHWNSSVYERLFLIAFKKRKYNICRVVWRHACMHRFVTYKMQQCVVMSLVTNKLFKSRSPEADIWPQTAGKVIVGLDFDGRGLSIPADVREMVPSEFHDFPLGYLLSGFKGPGEERTRQVRFGHWLVKRDIDLGFRYHPRRPLPLMLEAASVLDTRWGSTPRPAHWLIQNAIQVPVKKR